MSQNGCPPGVLRERLSDVVNCVKVIRVQRHRKYYNHLTFIDDLELTLVNVCNSEVSTVCIDRRYVLEYSSRFAMKIEAFSPDGRRLNILRRDEKCLLDKEPGLEYLCIRLNEAIKSGTYYTLILTHIAQTSNIVNMGWRRLGDFLTPHLTMTYMYSV